MEEMGREKSAGGAAFPHSCGAVLWSSGGVCRMAGQAGTSLNKTVVPLPGGGNAACVVLWMGFGLISVEAQLALPSPLL